MGYIALREIQVAFEPETYPDNCPDEYYEDAQMSYVYPKPAVVSLLGIELISSLFLYFGKSEPCAFQCVFYGILDGIRGPFYCDLPIDRELF